MSIRILVADDHPVVRDGLVTMLSTQPDFEVVGAVDNGRAVVEQARALQPDVVLLDLEMPELDGVEALAALRAVCPEARALVFTPFDAEERRLAAVRAGARGYLLKGAPRDELFSAVRVVSQGGSLLQPVVASRLLERMAAPPERAPDAHTERELEVLQHLAQGKANKEIAAALVISERTIKFHVSWILGKLGAANRTETARAGVQRGLVSM